MEILGETSNGFIVNMRKSELEQLTGYYYGRDKTFRVGMKVKVESLYMQLRALTQQDAAVKKMVHTLKTAAGMLEKIDPVFFEETKKE